MPGPMSLIRPSLRFVPLIALLLAPPAFQACTTSTAAAARRGARPEGGVPVVTTAVTQRDVPVELEAIGNVEASSTVSVRPQLNGQLMEARFSEGASVQKDQLLFIIDPRPFQAQLQQAEANAVRDRAGLNQAEANLSRDIAQASYAKVESDRFANLLERGLLSKEQADQSRTSADAAIGAVEADRAAVASAKAQVVAGEAAVNTAKLQLAYTEIRAPIGGRTGVISVKPGNIVTANLTELTTIAQDQPVNVTFAVPAENLPAVKRFMGAGSLAVEARPQDRDARPADGVLTFVDNAVDASTDTIKLKASMPNGDRSLWPGQFVRVMLRLTTLRKAVVIPTEALQTGQSGQYVFVVTPDSKVEQRPVKSGARIDQDVVVDQGLQPGETVVTEGQLRLEPGVRVQARADPPAPGQPPAGRSGGQGRGQRSSGKSDRAVTGGRASQTE